jgi:hypothetical protein
VVTRWRVLVFIIYVSFIWHPWLMIKWCGYPIVFTMIKKWPQVIWYEHRPPHLPMYLFIYLPTHLPTYLPIHLLNYPLTHLPTFSTYLLISYFLQPTYFLPINLQLAYYLPHNLAVVWNKHWKKLEIFWCYSPLVRIWFINLKVKGSIPNTCNLCTFLKY